VRDFLLLGGVLTITPLTVRRSSDTGGPSVDELARGLGFSIDAKGRLSPLPGRSSPARPRELVLVRHGKTQANLEERLQGRADGPKNQLTPKGRADAKQSAFALLGMYAPRLAALREKALVLAVSPLGRARATAEMFIELVRERYGFTPPLRIMADATEIDFGSIEGAARSEGSPADRDIAKRYRSHDVRAHGAGGETFVDVMVRERRLLVELAQASAAAGDAPVVLFAHGVVNGAIRALVGDRSVMDKTGAYVAWRQNLAAQQGRPLSV
jgi:broad specificity phosphatase PhoE